MSELRLNATISKIVKFEQSTGQSLTEVLNRGNVSVSNMVALAQAFSDASDEEIDTFVEKNGFYKLDILIAEALKKSGFLAVPQPNTQVTPEQQKTQ